MTPGIETNRPLRLRPAAAALGVNLATLHRWEAKGLIRIDRFAGCSWVSSEELQRITSTRAAPRSRRQRVRAVDEATV